MLTQRGRNPQPNTKRPPDETTQKQTVHIVFTAAVELATMKRADQRIIGIFENPVAAEKLEQRFNEAAQETDGIVVKAYTIRYTVPYTAPMVKQLLAE